MGLQEQVGRVLHRAPRTCMVPFAVPEAAGPQGWVQLRDKVPCTDMCVHVCACYVEPQMPMWFCLQLCAQVELHVASPGDSCPHWLTLTAMVSLPVYTVLLWSYQALLPCLPDCISMVLLKCVEAPQHPAPHLQRFCPNSPGAPPRATSSQAYLLLNPTALSQLHTSAWSCITRLPAPTGS